MEVKLVNLTPHEIVVLRDDWELHIPPSGTVARCETKRVVIGNLNVDGHSVPVNKTTFGKVDGLPAPAKDTLYIVASLVAQAVSNRDDLIIPDDSVRDDKGRIIGVKSFAKVN